MNTTRPDTPEPGRRALYRTIWRWHFYAGLFCVPFVLWLATTGAIYLFKPQIDAFAERAYDGLPLDGPAATPQAQVRAALAAVPGATLYAYELPRTPQSAARVLVAREGVVTRVYVHPQNLLVLGRVAEDDRFTRLIFRLHGELLLGDRGSMLVELAASWAIVMIVSGLYLWWPRAAGGLGGVVWPRLHRGGRVFWRDLHAVVGLWVSVFALFLLLSGLPWTHFWGGNLKTLRQFIAAASVQQDWSTGRGDERQQIRARTAPPDEHAGHHMGGGHAMHHEALSEADKAYLMGMPVPDVAAPYAPLDRLVPVVAALRLPPPVLIAPPSKASPDWSARSDTQNRPQRVNLTLDAERAVVRGRSGFGDKPLLDRIIGTGVAAHEGQLFGWFNQLLGLFTAIGLVTLSVSGLVMWWKRRLPGRSPATLGAPAAGDARVPGRVIALALAFGLFLPLLGASMLGVLLAERLVLRRLPRARVFLGLGA
ncbi:PepSY-associated TM helix domain-containing protein [Solimonas soli]|uniref:PepSY-associated TM helix domain-containing protein n=1 Tax=Solimonas soli TaxID=413479 RepID=UPI0004B2E184|nr:PepSY domain-containing protein [Solimonas soli]